jgi:stearoyl-CoA desaturase (delta-9 desaturase)
MGWLFDRDLTSDPIRFCPDLAREKELRFVSRHFLAFVLAGLWIPGLIDFGLQGGRPAAFLTGVLWGGLVRFFVGNHVTYAVNSVGHYFGARRFPTPDESRNVSWLAIPSFGEAWHNNHHAFPRAASHGMRWYEIDLSALVIFGLEKVGLAWDVIRIDPERLERRAAKGGGRYAPSAPPAPLAERKELAGVAITDVE